LIRPELDREDPGRLASLRLRASSPLPTVGLGGDLEQHPSGCSKPSAGRRCADAEEVQIDAHSHLLSARSVCMNCRRQPDVRTRPGHLTSRLALCRGSPASPEPARRGYRAAQGSQQPGRAEHPRPSPPPPRTLSVFFLRASRYISTSAASARAATRHAPIAAITTTSQVIAIKRGITGTSTAQPLTTRSTDRTRGRPACPGGLPRAPLRICGRSSFDRSRLTKFFRLQMSPMDQDNRVRVRQSGQRVHYHQHVAMASIASF
jgi:hypothetical protein